MKLKKYILFLAVLFISFFAFTNNSMAYDDTYTEQMYNEIVSRGFTPFSYVVNNNEVIVHVLYTTDIGYLNNNYISHKFEIYGSKNRYINFYVYNETDDKLFTITSTFFLFRDGNYVDSSFSAYCTSFVQYKDNLTYVFPGHTYGTFVDIENGINDDNFFPMPPQEVAHQILTVETMEEVQTTVLSQMRTITMIAIGILALLIGLRLLPKVLRRFSRS